MDKVQALHWFWSQFNMPAYEETTVPDNTPFPHITYEVRTDSFDYSMVLNATLWYRSNSWKEISQKVEEISAYITNMCPPTIKLDKGRLYIAKANPFAQDGADDTDREVRKKNLMIQVEFLTKE